MDTKKPISDEEIRKIMFRMTEAVFKNLWVEQDEKSDSDNINESGDRCNRGPYIEVLDAKGETKEGCREDS